MVSLNPMSVNIQTIILGNVLAIAPADIAQLAIIGAVSLTILLLKWKDLMVVFFDETHARSIGLNPGRLKLLFSLYCPSLPWRPCKPLGRSGDLSRRHAGRDGSVTHRPFPRLLMIAVVIGSLTSFLGAWQLLAGWRHGWNYCRHANLTVHHSLYFRPETRSVSQPSTRPPAEGADMFLTTLLEPFQFDFMVNALMVSVIVAIPAPYCPCF